MKKLVITLVAVIAVSLSGCSSMSDPNSIDVTSEETETSQPEETETSQPEETETSQPEETETPQPETLSGNCDTIQTEVSNVIPYLSGFAGEYAQSERYSAVSETAEKLERLLGT